MVRESYNGLKFIHGHSTVELDKLVKAFDQEKQRSVFWLDAHWSEGQDLWEKDECPLFDELRLILETSSKHIILIDDAGLFLASPLDNHDRNSWPNIYDICEYLGQKQYRAIVFKMLFVFIQKVILPLWGNC